MPRPYSRASSTAARGTRASKPSALRFPVLESRHADHGTHDAPNNRRIVLVGGPYATWMLHDYTGTTGLAFPDSLADRLYWLGDPAAVG